jgi:hypothetical protein
MDRNIIFIFLLILSSPYSYAQQEFWGTVNNGGQYGNGYIYHTNATGDQLEIVHHFEALEGKSPGELMRASNGKLYGMTATGGTGIISPYHKGGVLYEYDPILDSFRVVVHFNANFTNFPYDGPDVTQAPTEVGPGILYGQVLYGGLQVGRIFSYNLNTGELTEAFSVPIFMGGPMNTQQGNRLGGPIYKASDGYLYSTTQSNSQCPLGQPNRGSIVRINPADNSYSTVYLNPCSSMDGWAYQSSFVEENGSLYSVARYGGTADKGVIYQFTPSTNTYVKKHDFAGGALGQNPSPMVKANNGKFYGVAEGIEGILYEYDPVAETFAKKIDFTYGNGWVGTVGAFPMGQLIQGHNGKLYGKTRLGIFEYDLASNTTRAAGRYMDNSYPQPIYASLVQICREPSYQFCNEAAWKVCKGALFSHDLQCTNATAVVWKKNGVIRTDQTSTTLLFNSISAADTGTWQAELSNECGITITQPLQVLFDLTVATIVAQQNQLESSPGISYQWLDCNQGYAEIDGATVSSFIPSASGYYAVEVTYACTKDTSACVEFEKISTDLDTRNTPIKISLFPNPAQREVTLVTEEKLEEVILLNYLGQPVLSTNSALVDLSLLMPGTYVLMVHTDIGTWRGKIVKVP